MCHTRPAMYTIVRTDLGPFGDQWDALVDALPVPSPFLRSWWIDNAASGEPVLVLVVDGDELRGGIALQRSTRHRVEWYSMVGNGPLEPDHLDALALPAHRPAVISALRAWMTRRGNRVFDLDGLVPDGVAVAALPSRAIIRSVTPAPYARLPRAPDEYLATRHGRLRSTVTRTAKRLDRAGVTFRAADPDEIDASLDALHRLHDSRWGDHSAFLGGWDQFARSMRAGNRAGDVRFGELVDPEGRIVATELELRADRRLCFYQAGRVTDHELRGSGSVLKARIIESGIAEGFVEFDLLRGDEPYKAEWADARRSLVHVRSAVGPLARALVSGADVRRRRRRSRNADNSR